VGEIIEYLNANSGALTVLFTAIVTFSTVAYALLTWSLVVETKRMREVQTEPKMQIALIPKDFFVSFIDVEISNVGLGPAYDVRFALNPAINCPASQKLCLELQEMNLLKNGMGYFAPKQQIRSFLTSMIEEFENKKAARIDVRISYRSATLKNYADTYILDFSEMVGLSQLGEPPLEKMAKHIESLDRACQRLTSGLHRLNVDVYSNTDREHEAAQRKQRQDEHRRESQAGLTGPPQ
jgi:hypothetical protein